MLSQRLMIAASIILASVLVLSGCDKDNDGNTTGPIAQEFTVELTSETPVNEEEHYWAVLHPSLPGAEARFMELTDEQRIAVFDNVTGASVTWSLVNQRTYDTNEAYGDIETYVDAPIGRWLIDGRRSQASTIVRRTWCEVSYPEGIYEKASVGTGMMNGGTHWFEESEPSSSTTVAVELEQPSDDRFSGLGYVYEPDAWMPNYYGWVLDQPDGENPQVPFSLELSHEPVIRTIQSSQFAFYSLYSMKDAEVDYYVGGNSFPNDSNGEIWLAEEFPAERYLINASASIQGGARHLQFQSETIPAHIQAPASSLTFDVDPVSGQFSNVQFSGVADVFESDWYGSTGIGFWLDWDVQSPHPQGAMRLPEIPDAVASALQPMIREMQPQSVEFRDRSDVGGYDDLMYRSFIDPSAEIPKISPGSTYRVRYYTH